MADDRVALIKQVKEANDIVQVVGSYLDLHPVGPTFKGLCPFHDDHRPSFDVDPRRRRYRCWACGKYGDVITFVQELERVDFREALELLARRAGINLKKTADSPQQRSRAFMLDVVRWASDQFQRCLLDSPLADAARRYVEERGLSKDTVLRYGLGFAPGMWDWLTLRAAAAGISAELLEKVGLIAARREGNGHYDRFRERLMFPIRDARGNTVGFGGRILPSTTQAEPGPKYYNSSETPLFNKSEQLYGLDVARQAGAKVGYLAVVEGYTDVLMAHQLGVQQVVATMGTALNEHHVQQLRRFAPRVVLVFDADAGGNTGVDRALEIFASEDVDLSIATLPEGLDPCDLLLKEGADAFRAVLDKAVDALDFKLSRLLASGGVGKPAPSEGVEGRRKAVESVLGIIALAPEMPGQAGEVKRQLIVSRISQRMGIQEETLRRRLQELRRGDAATRRRGDAGRHGDAETTPQTRQAVALPEEKELLEILLAAPELIPDAQTEVQPDAIGHPGLRQLLVGLYDLHNAGQDASMDNLRPSISNTALVSWALERQEIGRENADPRGWLQKVLAIYRKRRTDPERRDLQDQLHAVQDHDAALKLLRQLQTNSSSQ